MGPRKTRHGDRGTAGSGTTTDMSRVEHQKELAQQLHERALERLREGDMEVEKSETKKDAVAYKSADRFPRDKAKDLKILVGACLHRLNLRYLAQFS